MELAHLRRLDPTTAEMLKIMEEEGLIGMWKDRDDIGDNVEFARKLREQAGMRTSNVRCLTHWNSHRKAQ